MTEPIERGVRCGVLLVALLCAGPVRAGDPSVVHFYVANTAKGDHTVSVVDHASRSEVARIDVGGVPHGSAASPTGDRVYVTLEDVGEVVAIDTASHRILWRAAIAPNPDPGKPAPYLNEPSLSRDGRFLWAPDLLGERLVVVDTAVGEMVDQLPLRDPADGQGLSTLHNTYLSADGKWLFATSIFGRKIARIDVEDRKIGRIYRLSGQPRPAALRDDLGKMYVQFSQLHGFVELDLSTGAETARITWPEPRESPDDFTKCHGIGIRPDQRQLWAASNIEGAVYVYSLPDLRQLARVPVGHLPNWLAFTPDGRFAYVTTQEEGDAPGRVSAVDTESFEVVARIPVGARPKRIHEVEIAR